MLLMHRGEYLLTFCGRNYVSCGCIIVRKHHLALLTMFPTNAKNKIRFSEFQGCNILGFMVEPPDVKIFFIFIKQWANHTILYTTTRTI